jgi:hypothetical protein
MRAKIITTVFLTLTAITLSAQESGRPRIGNITVLPSEPILPSGNCSASRFGYLEKDGKTKFTEAEIGKFVSSSLRDGYVLTIYPETGRGMFVDMECTADSKAPSRP